MKIVIPLLVFAALAAAAPNSRKINFRNLYKQPVGKPVVKPQARIIGGQEATPHSIPHQAFVEEFSADEAWYCGGSLISLSYVLVAGHCNVGGIEARVTLGAHTPYQSEPSQYHVVSTELIVHEGYDADNIVNDLGVIKFPQPVTLTPEIQIIALPTRADAANDYVGTMARTSGWGRTSYLGGLSDVLNYVDVTVISNQECADAFDSIPESNICTSGDADTGICIGDSGGPLTAGGKLIGVASFMVSLCQHGYPSGYSRTTYFLDWIAANTDVVIQ